MRMLEPRIYQKLWAVHKLLALELARTIPAIRHGGRHSTYARLARGIVTCIYPQYRVL